MRSAVLAIGCLAIAGCALFDPDEEPPQDSVPPAVLNSSACTDLWKHYTDELQLITDDEGNWQVHDDKAMQYFSQFGGPCNAADQREPAAAELRCKALWGLYVKEVGRMTKDNRTWRDRDVQQMEAMNRIRNNCTNTACTFLPGIRCLVPNDPS